MDGLMNRRCVKGAKRCGTVSTQWSCSSEYSWRAELAAQLLLPSALPTRDVEDERLQSMGVKVEWIVGVAANGVRCAGS